MLKHKKLPSKNSTKSGAHKNLAKIHENEHTPGLSSVNLLFGDLFDSKFVLKRTERNWTVSLLARLGLAWSLYQNR